MAAFTTEQMTEYLKRATELEVSVYQQQQILEKAKSSLRLHQPTQFVAQKPVKTVYKQPQCPKEPVKPENPGTFAEGFARMLKEAFTSKAGISSIISFMFMGACLGVVVGGILFISELVESFWGIILVGALLGLLTSFLIASHLIKREIETYERNIKEYFPQKKAYDNAVEEYHRQQVLYQENTEKAEQDYQAALVDYEKQKRSNTRKYNSQMKTAKDRYQIAQNDIAIMDKVYHETEDVLQQLYAAGPVFPKYQTMIAISTMYEYFVTGRCSELTGPDGAYNLYESELRQNLIINKLDVIISNLEAIRDNQYVLYTELKSIGQTANQIAGDISKICDTTKRLAKTAENIDKTTQGIAYSQRIATEYARITAQNTEALKYIALVN